MKYFNASCINVSILVLIMIIRTLVILELHLAYLKDTIDTKNKVKHLILVTSYRQYILDFNQCCIIQ